ncbi:phage portal protein [Amycolatopsis halotolerans]
MEQAVRLVDALESELLRRQTWTDLYEGYYRGDQPLKFASDEFRRFHGERYAGFADNWIQVVADSPVERLTNIGIQPYDETEADKESWRVAQVNGFEADSQLGFLGAVTAGRSFVLVWGDPDDDETPIVSFEDAGQAIVAYEPGSRTKRRAALKRWQDGDSVFATLYLPDEVWKFERPFTRMTKSPQESSVDEAFDGWSLRETATEKGVFPNPLGVVPMVELRNRPMLTGDPISDVAGVIAMQDAINMLWAHLFTASDSAAFPQKVLLGAERPVVPILDHNGQVVGEKAVDLAKLAVDKVLVFEGESAKIDEWSAANLNAFTDIIEVAVGHIAAQTRTPQHYLIGKMANLSGDALIAAETGLVQRTREKQLWFGQGLREMYALIALAQNNIAKAKALRAGRTLWTNPQFRSEAQLSDSLLKDAQMGFPFEWLAAQKGLTPQEIDDVLEMKKRQAAMDPIADLARGLTPEDSSNAYASGDSSPSGRGPASVRAPGNSVPARPVVAG